MNTLNREACIYCGAVRDEEGQMGHRGDCPVLNENTEETKTRTLIDRAVDSLDYWRSIGGTDWSKQDEETFQALKEYLQKGMGE